MSILMVGAVCFGVVAGYITYRTLVRTKDTAVSDLAAVFAAIGGGAVTVLFDSKGEQFAWYAIGLLIGMAVFLILRLVIEVPRAKESGEIPIILGDPKSAAPAAPAPGGGGFGR